MKIKINKKTDVIVEKGCIYEHTSRVGIFICSEKIEDGQSNLYFICLATGFCYDFSAGEREKLLYRGKLIDIETSI